MKKLLVLFVGAIFLLSGCSNPEAKISETEAIESVIDFHQRHIGKVELISVNHDDGRYLVEWENEENCEYGKDYVDDQNGEIEMGETTIC